MASASEIDPQPAGTFWALNLEGALPDEVKPRLAARFARVDTEATPALARAMRLADSAPVLERFARQRRCYGAWLDRALVAYGWVTFDMEWIGELGLQVRLSPGEAYIWDCATLPAFRGQHLYPALLTYISRELDGEGFQRILIGADSDNLPSQKGMARAGFQPVADIVLASTRAESRMRLQGRPGVPERLITHLRQALTHDEGRLL